ncbi:S8 family peptidase [Bacillus sp. SCS-153A]|uniref:S8 family peptidase n=1 Tax=Rossellomorea sedimentorum TaxID=3115294 RepID=UPI003905AF5C
MFGYSMVQLVRTNAHRLDKSLREEILNLYKPFRWTPCFLHRFFEGSLKHMKKLQVIIEFENGCQAEGTKEIERVTNNHLRSRVKSQFSRISCCSAELSPSGLEEVLTSCQHVKKVYLNRKVQALLDTAVDSANAANIIRQGRRLTGKGVTIAIIDTGIHPHQDLAGRIKGFKDFINDRPDPYDDNGHGTHCAGDAAGDGSASSGQYTGPAPQADVVGVKVLDKMGSGSLDTVMQGVQWCMDYNDHNPDSKIDIISMSLGSTAQSYETENDDPMVKIVEEAWASGIVVCIAAGNEGPDAGTIASPGISDQVITVGALSDNDTADTREDDEVASFSSRGPTIYGKAKPDILAPGVNIVSLRSPNSYLDKLQKANRVGEEYFVLSGTSMATPICAGIAALILEQSPQVTPGDVKTLLIEGADLWKDRNENIYGAGYINAENSVPGSNL